MCFYKALPFIGLSDRRRKKSCVENEANTVTWRITSRVTGDHLGDAIVAIVPSSRIAARDNLKIKIIYNLSRLQTTITLWTFSSHTGYCWICLLQFLYFRNLNSFHFFLRYTEVYFQQKDKIHDLIKLGKLLDTRTFISLLTKFSTEN